MSEDNTGIGTGGTTSLALDRNLQGSLGTGTPGYGSTHDTPL